MRRSRTELRTALHKGAEAPRDAEVRVLRVAILVGLGVAAAALLGLMLWPFLPALVTSVVLGVLAFPAHQSIHKRIPQDETAAFVSTLAVVVVILLPIFGVSLIALQDVSTGVDWLQDQVRTGFPMLGGLVVIVERVLNALGLAELNVPATLTQRLENLPDLVVGRTFRVVSGIGGIVLQVGVGLFTLFYLFRDGERMLLAARSHVPLASGPTEVLALRAREVMFAAVFGHVFVALVQGLLGGLAFWALGVPTPVVWGVLMSGLSLIPLVGPAFVWVPAGAVLIATGAPIRGVLLLAFGLFVISTVDNVIRAVLVSARARVHPLVVFFGVLGGVLMFGAVGILVGPVLIVMAGALMEMARLSLFPEDVPHAAQAQPLATTGAAPERPPLPSHGAPSAQQIS
jgi:predicted PurR-regulated permease PerM